MLKTLVVSLVTWIVIAAVLLGAAGRWDLPVFWIYLVLLLVPTILVPLLERRHPGLLQERLHPGPGERDAFSNAAQRVCLPITWIVAGLDIGRFHWSRALPLGLEIAGLALATASLAITSWAMWVNPFFSSAVRLQPERGQRVVSAGPYQVVRHPGYSGAVLFTIGSGLALGSWWAMLPLALVAAVLVRRTQLEDRMLRGELPAYAEYARTVRFRLVPGLW